MRDNHHYLSCPKCGRTCKHESADYESNKDRLHKVGKRDDDPFGLSHTYTCTACEADPHPYKTSQWSSVEVPSNFLKALISYRDETEARIRGLEEHITSIKQVLETYEEAAKGSLTSWSRELE